MEYEKHEGRSIGFREAVKTMANRKRLFLALSIAPLAMLTGSNIITYVPYDLFCTTILTLEPRYYFGSMLSQAGISDPHTQLEINVILSCWQLVCAIAGSCLAERLGRRVLALVSLGTCTAFLYLLAGLTAKFGTSHDKSGTYGTVSVIFLFLGAYSFGITPLTAMYGPEVLSYRIRATGVALQGIGIKSCGVLVTMAFPYMLSDIGWKTYVVNASWNILFWAYIFFQWVETKGKTLEEIDALFDGTKHSSVPDLKDLGAIQGLDIEKDDVTKIDARVIAKDTQALDL